MKDLTNEADLTEATPDTAAEPIPDLAPRTGVEVQPATPRRAPATVARLRPRTSGRP